MDTEDIRQKEAYKMELNKRVENLLRSGIPTKDIASFLGGEEFLRIEEQRGQQEPVTIFDVRGFVESQLMKGKPIRLPDETRYLDDTILPPGDGEIVSGSGAGIDAKEIVPRTTYLMELLEEMRFSYTLFSGTHTPGMVRGLDYVGFYIPHIQKLILVNNEEGNATFVIHTVRNEDDVQLLLSCTKQELRDPDINDFPTDWVPYTAGSVDEWKNILKEKLKEKLMSQPPPDTGATHITGSRRDKFSALKELEEAYLKWHSLPEKERGKFNARWLENNEYAALCYWARRQGNTPLETLSGISSISGLSKSFEKREKSQPYTPETALIKLEDAYFKWHSLPEDKKGKFTIKWLEKNGYQGLYAWSRKKGRIPLETLVSASTVHGLSESFEKMEKSQPYTSETALTKLEEAFFKWSALSEEKREKFNGEWLIKNRYEGLYGWSRKKGCIPLETLVSASTVHGLSESFEKMEKSQPYTSETALTKLEEAYLKWHSLSEEERGEFNVRWLQKNRYGGLVNWARIKANTPLEILVSTSTVPGLRESFKKR